MEIAFGFCHCGCGEKTKLCPRTRPELGLVKGQPRLFANGHNSRKLGELYLVEDRGYKTPCWIWQKYIDATGYGSMWFEGVMRQAYRVFYEQKFGPLPECKPPDWIELDHLCRVRACMNPDHVEPVTHAINMRRGANTKLSAEIILQIRASPFPQRKVARLFGICQTHVSRIKRGACWSDV